MQLTFPDKNDIRNVDLVGVALKQYSKMQNHIAIVFYDESDMSCPSLLHVSGHKAPLVDNKTNGYAWMDLTSELSSLRKQVLLANIMQIAEVNSEAKVRYGFDHGLYCLDPETGILNGNYTDSKGLTCATFVVEVFLSVGISLIDFDSWPVHENSSIEFQFNILGILEEIHERRPDKVSQSYLIEQRKNIGNPRFLPQEIAASTQYIQPSSKQEIEADAAAIHTQLTEFTDSITTSGS